MFDVKIPCKDCPFVEGSCTNETLSEKRMTQIKGDLLQDQSFSCHKTVDYEGNGKKKEQHCAGAMAWLYKHDRPNQMMRIGERVGAIHPNDFKKFTNIID